jgi:hypothetical protein
LVAAAWHAHPVTAIFASGHLRAVSASEGEDDMVEPSQTISILTRDGLSSPPSYQM